DNVRRDAAMDSVHHPIRAGSQLHGRAIFVRASYCMVVLLFACGRALAQQGTCWAWHLGDPNTWGSESAPGSLSTFSPTLAAACARLDRPTMQPQMGGEFMSTATYFPGSFDYATTPDAYPVYWCQSI